MRTNILGLGLSVFWVALALGDEAGPKEDYTQMSRLIQNAVVQQLPKVYLNESGWGQTVPIPDKLRLRNLRTVVKVGNNLELPNGTWRKTKVWVADPAREVDVQVRSLKKINDSTYRLRLDGGVVLRSETELQHWTKGLKLLDIVAKADADIGLSLDCDVALSVDAKLFPPGVKIEPKVTDLKMELRDFHLKEVDSRRFGLLLEGQEAREVSNEIKGVLQGLVQAAEPMVKEQANQAIARALKDGKGTFSAASLLKALTPRGKN